MATLARLLDVAADEARQLIEGDRPLLGDQAQQLELPRLGRTQRGRAAPAASQLADLLGSI